MDENQAFCPGCGSRINPDAAFCPQCGTKTIPQAPTFRQPEQQPVQQPVQQPLQQQRYIQQPPHGQAPQQGQYQTPVQPQFIPQQGQYGQHQQQVPYQQQPARQGQQQYAQQQPYTQGQPQYAQGQQPYTQGYPANMPQYTQGQYRQQGVPYPRKKSGGGKAIAVLIIIALLGVGGWWLSKNVFPNLFNASNIKALAADRLSGEYAGTAAMTSAKGEGSEVYGDMMNEDTVISFSLILDKKGEGQAVFSEIYAGMGQMEAKYDKGSLKMTYDMAGVEIIYTGTAQNKDGFINFTGDYSLKVENGPELRGRWKAERNTALTDEDLEAIDKVTEASQAAGGGNPATIGDLLGLWEGTLSYTEYVGLDEDDSVSQEEKDRIKGMLDTPFKLQVGIYEEDGIVMASFTVYDDEEDPENSTEIGTGPVEYGRGKFSCHFADSGVDVTFTGTVKGGNLQGTFVGVPEEPMGSIKSVEGSFNVSFKSETPPE